MDYVKLLKEKLNAQKALVNTAVTEKRAMTAEEQKQFDDLEVEIKNLDKTIEAQKAIEDKDKDLETPKDTIYAQPKNPNEKKWKGGLGEFLVAVANYSLGRGVDNRLFSNAASGMSVGVGADGGFLLDSNFVAGLQDAMRAQAQVANRIRMIPIGENTDTLKTLGIDETSRVTGSRWGGVRGYWVAEAGEITSSKPKFRKVEIQLEKLAALYYATDELLRDAVALQNVITMAYGDEMAWLIDEAIINGSGVGQPTVVLNSGSLVSVAKESGQAADTVVFENVLKMWNRLPARARANAVWYINQEIEPQLYTMSLAIGTAGVPVYMPANGANGSPYSSLFGRPVVPIEQCAKLGDKGDIILMDPTQYIGIDKDGVQAASSIHVKFSTDESVFRFIYRFNGAPYMTSAITPANGNTGYTLSPFVTLAARA